MTERSALDRWLPRVAWAMWTVTAALLALHIVIWSLPPAMQISIWSMPPSLIETLSIRQISLWLVCLIAATMGALIASLRPRNPIGWWLSVLALAFTTNVLGSVYARYALVRSPGALPSGDLALWIAESGRNMNVINIHDCVFAKQGMRLSTRPSSWPSSLAKRAQFFLRRWTSTSVSIVKLATGVNRPSL
jgi:hypothetical protein